MILGVLYYALDRRPPFDKIERSAFDVAVGRVPPPPGLTREQFRRAVFEEWNLLPWSEGLEPPKGGSWLKLTPLPTALDQMFVIRPDLYRLKRKLAKHIVDRMRADGSLDSEVHVDLVGDIVLRKDTRADVWISTIVRAAYRAAPLAHSEMWCGYLDRVPILIRPPQIFLNPDLGGITSDEEAERTIRQMWGYADALFGAVGKALRNLPPAASDE